MFVAFCNTNLIENIKFDIIKADKYGIKYLLTDKMKGGKYIFLLY